MADLAQAVTTGWVLGGTYSLIAVGLVLAFRATETFNFAHGQFMLVGAFLIGRWQRDNIGPLAFGLIIMLLFLALAGIGLHRVVLQRLVGQPLFMAVIATIGLAIFIDGGLALVFGPRDYTVELPGLPDDVVSIWGARISSGTLLLSAMSYAIVLALAAWLRYSHRGTLLRAVGQDPLLASQSGIHVHRLHMATWAMVSVLAGVAGILYGSRTLVSPAMPEVALLAFPALLLGGIDSVAGAVLGGLIVGLLQGFVSTYWTGEMVTVTTYSVLLLVLLVLPEGLLGTRSVKRV